MCERGCEYLSRRLDAENSYSCLRIVLEAMDQLDPFCGGNAAIDADISSLGDDDFLF